MWKMDGQGRIFPILEDIKEAYNMPRQQLPLLYYQNACIDVIRAKTIMKKNSMSGSCILGYEMKENYDIDTEEDFAKADKYLSGQFHTRNMVSDIHWPRE